MRVERPTQLLPRSIPELGAEIIKVGARLNLKPLAQTADMASFVFFVKGKPTYLYVLAKYNAATALRGPIGHLAKRKGLVITDRDGPLDKTSAFLNKPDKQVIAQAMVPAALSGCKRLHEANVGLAVATNQGGYQTGAMSFVDTVSVNVRIAQQIANAGGHLDLIVICPFSKAADSLGAGEIDARKPSPGQPLYIAQMCAAARIPVLALIGDQRTDGAAAQAAGVPFIAITDPVNGRWKAELDAALKKGEALPQLDPAKMRLTHDFGGAVDLVLKR